jgi:hypothetical protein
MATAKTTYRVYSVEDGTVTGSTNYPTLDGAQACAMSLLKNAIGYVIVEVDENGDEETISES